MACGIKAAAVRINGSFMRQRDKIRPVIRIMDL